MPSDQSTDYFPSLEPPYFVVEVEGRLDFIDNDVSVRRLAIYGDALAPGTDGKLSLFRVEHSHETAQIMVALMFNQKRQRSRIYLFPILPNEIEHLSLAHTPDNCDLDCKWAKQRHWDLVLSDTERQTLTNTLLAARREPGNVIKRDKPKMRGYRAAAEARGCMTIEPGSQRCRCETEGITLD